MQDPVRVGAGPKSEPPRVLGRTGRQRWVGLREALGARLKTQRQLPLPGVSGPNRKHNSVCPADLGVLL